MKVLWVSHNDMTPEQLQDLHRIYGDLEVVRVMKKIKSAFDLKEEIDNADIIAIVVPPHLQKQFLRAAKGKPVIFSKGQFFDEVYTHDNWCRLKKVEIAYEIL